MKDKPIYPSQYDNEVFLLNSNGSSLFLHKKDDEYVITRYYYYDGRVATGYLSFTEILTTEGKANPLYSSMFDSYTKAYEAAKKYLAFL